MTGPQSIAPEGAAFSKKKMMPEINLSAIPKKAFTIEISGIKHSLSERQISVFVIFMFGKSSKEIANQLKISPRTIEKHIEVLKNKFKCNRRSELNLIGLKNHLDNYAFRLNNEKTY